jgi:hypothetical protein
MFPGGKSGRCVGLKTLKFGSLSLLEPSGTVQGYNWIALPLPGIIQPMLHTHHRRYVILVINSINKRA